VNCTTAPLHTKMYRNIISFARQSVHLLQLARQCQKAHNLPQRPTSATAVAPLQPFSILHLSEVVAAVHFEGTAAELPLAVHVWHCPELLLGVRKALEARLR